jgi:hypothetical protein
MPVRTISAATIAAAVVLAFAAPASFAADQMSNSHNSGSSAMAPDKGTDSAMAHSGGDSMSHPGSGKMSSGSQTAGSAGGDTTMSHDKMSK